MEKHILAVLLLLLLNIHQDFFLDADCQVGSYQKGSKKFCAPCFPAQPQKYHHNMDCKSMCTRGYAVRTCESACSYMCFNESCLTMTTNFKTLSPEILSLCVLSCAKGWYGEMCDKNCSNGFTNKCITCHDATYGSLCENACTNCKSDRCDKGGICTEGCKENYHGPKCDKCQPGLYGNNCEFSCNSRCNDCVCNKTTGTCTQGCSNSFYGLFCNNTCNAGCIGRNCDRRTGECTEGCLNPFYGLFCNSSCDSQCRGAICNHTTHACTDGCENTSLGTHCAYNCNTGCSNGTCHQTTGACTYGCNITYYGVYCNHSCSTGCIGGICNQTTGACSHGCNTTYYGVYCNHTCSNTCSEGECLVNELENLTCTYGCDNGWWGSYCQRVCPENCQICHKKFGICLQCFHAFKYGSNCSDRCSENCVGEECDMTGICSQGCVHGWMGKQCQFSVLWFVAPGLIAAVSVAVCLTIMINLRRVSEGIYTIPQDNVLPIQSIGGGERQFLGSTDHIYQSVPDMEHITLEDVEDRSEGDIYQAPWC